MAVVFGVAAMAKLRNPMASAQGARELHVPTRLVPIVARLVPALEATVAGLLVIPTVPPFVSIVGAVLAMFMLTAFTFAIVRLLRKGHTPTCFCFGSRNPQPAGSDTVLRNLALCALCVVVALGPH